MIVYTVLAIAGCGESSVVEFSLGSIDARGGREYRGSDRCQG